MTVADTSLARQAHFSGVWHSIFATLADPTRRTLNMEAAESGSGGADAANGSGANNGSTTKSAAAQLEQAVVEVAEDGRRRE